LYPLFAHLLLPACYSQVSNAAITIACALARASQSFAFGFGGRELHEMVTRLRARRASIDSDVQVDHVRGHLSAIREMYPVS